MQIVKKDQRVQHQNSPICLAFEYPTHDNDINGAVIELKGRYPAVGRASNIECKEMAYIISGSGKIMIENHELLLSQGDLIIIHAGERFYWDGIMTLFVSCSPAWNAQQHRYID